MQVFAILRLRQFKDPYLKNLMLLMLFLTITGLTYNTMVTGYHGNNYFPTETLGAVCTTLLILYGFLILYDHNHKSVQVLQDFVFYLLFFSLYALFTNAIQYTPFPPIDQYIVRLESFLGIHMTHYMQWIHHYPESIPVLEEAYGMLNLEIWAIPCIMILLQKNQAMHRFYILMILSGIIGFGFYYLFPTTAPASVLESPYFMVYQKATLLKFTQIHHAETITTTDGGLIACPSFHVIWSLLCQDLARSIPWIFWILLPINLVLILSCVLLGWHYPTDIVASLGVLCLVFYLYRQWKIPQYY